MGEDLARGHTAVARQGSRAAFCLVTPQVNGPWVRELSEGALSGRAPEGGRDGGRAASALCPLGAFPRLTPFALLRSSPPRRTRQKVP